jgi:hypothetical protein
MKLEVSKSYSPEPRPSLAEHQPPASVSTAGQNAANFVNWLRALPRLRPRVQLVSAP